jgi:hypothetical protein
MRLVLLLLLFFGCVRRFEEVEPNETPAFLGAASGVYVAENHSLGLASRVVTAIEVENALLLGIGDFGSTPTQALILTGQLTEVDGLPSFTQQLTVSVREGAPDFARMFPMIAHSPMQVEATVQVGFDAFTLTLRLKDSEGVRAVCAAFAAVGATFDCASIISAPIVYDAHKVCDFDPRLSGVYRAQVRPDGCSSPLEGNREWVVVLSNASPVAALMSLRRREPEFGALLDFVPHTLSANLTKPAPFGDRPLQDDDAVSFGLTIGEATTDIKGHVVVDGCAHEVTATRLTGSKEGLTCTRTDLCQELSPAACPQLPPGVLGFYEFDGFVDDQNAPCPVPVCSLTLSLGQACNAASPVFSTGCPVGTTVALGGTGACFVAGCVPNPACDAIRPLVSVFPSSCVPSGFTLRSFLGCTFALCQ